MFFDAAKIAGFSGVLCTVEEKKCANSEYPHIFLFCAAKFTDWTNFIHLSKEKKVKFGQNSSKTDKSRQRLGEIAYLCADRRSLETGHLLKSFLAKYSARGASSLNKRHWSKRLHANSPALSFGSDNRQQQAH